jgi:peptidoglycan/xylan/chitin deacetylase (PgdA/CDA1 family)
MEIGFVLWYKTEMKPDKLKFSRLVLTNFLALTLLLSACSPAQAATPETDFAMTAIFESALLTATYAVPAATSTPEPPTATPVPTIPLIPPDLPPVYISSLLNPNDTPHAYIEDTCQYLKMRWDPNNSTPGTVVMPIMFHGIVRGESDNLNDNQITDGAFKNLMKNLKEMGFETITSQQLVDFLERNAKIPSRSIILILDDRSPGGVREHFLPILEEYNWTVTLGFPIGAGPDSTDFKPASYLETVPDENFKTLWEQMEAYNRTGRLDVQSHGYVHNINMGADSTEEFLHTELYESARILEEHFGKRPIAIVWPGGGFSKRPAEVAREAGYRLGFTVNPRGPVMFNWVPQADAADGRPYIPEGPTGDPLMTLPRYWNTTALYELDNVRIIGKEAAEQAELNKAVELQYYEIMCKPLIGEIPAPAP